jgi:hypothetical protein
LSVLISNLRQRDVVRLFATRMRGDYGSTTDVEISAVAVTTGEQRCLGFTIRDVGLRLNSETKPSRELPRSTGQMTELVGRVPLKDIVREYTPAMVGGICGVPAADITAAARMFGQSRATLSLYCQGLNQSSNGTQKRRQPSASAYLTTTSTTPESTRIIQLN